MLYLLGCCYLYTESILLAIVTGIHLCDSSEYVFICLVGSFFCDCGEKGEKFCQALKKRSANDNGGSKIGRTSAPAASSVSGVSYQVGLVCSCRDSCELSSLLMVEVLCFENHHRVD